MQKRRPMRRQNMKNKTSSNVWKIMKLLKFEAVLKNDSFDKEN